MRDVDATSKTVSARRTTTAKHDALRASVQLYTVADAVTDYVDYLRAHRKSALDTESKLTTYVVHPLHTRRRGTDTSGERRQLEHLFRNAHDQSF